MDRELSERAILVAGMVRSALAMTTTIGPPPSPSNPVSDDVWGFPVPPAPRYWNLSAPGSGAWTQTDRWLPAAPPTIAAFSPGALLRPLGIWYRNVPAGWQSLT
ncbi:MAG: hypothetical protein C5B60_10560 [Chloroflexi bacterium]|nr:MAG: hypothetical protein C5B60_10560 [Chloroflexota bacterium]